MGVYGALFWVGVGVWENIFVGWGWVGMSGGEWGWVGVDALFDNDRQKNIVRNMEVFEIWRFKLWEVTYNSLLGIFTLPEK